MADEEPVVLAAGGVVWRRGPQGVEILLVHRPRYDDWSLPKGKLKPGEDAADGAVREVAEETGLETELGAELATSRYRDAQGRPKVVRYWAMTPLGGEFEPNHEVDAIQWVAVGEAPAVLTYQRDAEVLAAL